MRKGAKRKATDKAESWKKNPSADEQMNEPSQSPDQPAEPSENGAAKGRRKRARFLRPEIEPEYFNQQRNFEDLWKEVFLVGTEWDNLDMIYQYKWNFSSLEDTFEEGGELYNTKVYLFGLTEAHMVYFQGEEKVKVIMVPAVVAVVSPFPPSDKIGITSVQRGGEQIVPMKQMKMDWVPYFPLEKRESQVERLRESQIFILKCTQRRAGLKHLKVDRVMEFTYCLAYFYNPLQEDETKYSTEVHILYPIDSEETDSREIDTKEVDSKDIYSKLVNCEFDWKFDDLEEFTDDLIKERQLPVHKKEHFKEFVKEKVQEAKRANHEARETRRKAIEEMSEETKAAFQNMKFFKFYPASTPDTPAFKKSSIINRYYGKAHKVI